MHKTSNPAPPQKVSGILYDIPYLVRDPNEFRMSEKRHQIEVKNQAVVDDYFIARANGFNAADARKKVAEKHGITTKRVQTTIVWFFNEAKKRKKYEFLQKFSHLEEH
jgi:hypothetical protein